MECGCKAAAFGFCARVDVPRPTSRGAKTKAGAAHEHSIKLSEFMFTVLDQTEKRLDLAERREVKFVLTGSDIGTLRRVLETNTRRQIHNHEVSTVRSVYFDDARLSACQANLDGLGIRRKLRLRWYDQLMPGHEGYLEIKWRNNRVTGKHRMHVTC
jgi:VTC domain